MPKTIYKSNKIRTTVAVGLFTALAYVCCVIFHFKVSFLTFDLKDAVMTVGAMLLGPVYGLAMAVTVSLIEAVTISTTGAYGFIMNVLASVAFVCVGSAIYSRRRNMSGALVGMGASVVAMTAVMIPANLLVTPFYWGVTVGEVIAMIPTLLLPFNLTKAVFNASVVFLLYKPLSSALRQAGFYTNTAQSLPETVSATHAVSEKSRSRRKTNIAVTVVSLVVGALALVYFFLKLGGSFSFK